MNSHERVFNALNGNMVDRPPILPYIGDHAGIIYDLNYRDMYTNAKNAAEAHLYSLNLYKYDICSIQVEPSWPVAEACGAEVTYPTEKNPWITKHLIESKNDFHKLKTPINFRKTKSTKVMIDGTKILSEKARIPVAAFMTGPLTFSFQIMPYINLIKLMMSDPDSAKELIQKAIKIIKSYLSRLKNAGADLGIICEHDFQMLSPELVKAFSLDYLEEIFGIFENNILHVCGKVKSHLHTHSELLKNMKKLKMISIGPHLDISNIQKLFNNRIGVAGNIDHFKLLPQGTPKQITYAVHRAIDAAGGCPRFMIAPGCEITADTPIRNVKAFVDAARSYYIE